MIDQRWSKRAGPIRPEERDPTRRAFDRARDTYRAIAAEAPKGS